MKRIRLPGIPKRIFIVVAIVAIIGAGWLWMQRSGHDSEAKLAISTSAMAPYSAPKANFPV